MRVLSSSSGLYGLTLCCLIAGVVSFLSLPSNRLITTPKLSTTKNILKFSLIAPEWSLPRLSVLTEIDDTPGALHEILRYFWKYEINLTHIESRPTTKNSEGFNIYIDFHGQLGESRTDKLMRELRARCKNMLVLDEREVPWFPRHISDLDRIASRTLDAGADLEADHPGFHDPVYRKRRTELATIAQTFAYGDEIPVIQYTPEEISTWGTVYSKLKSLQDKYACPEYLKILPLMEKYCGYGENNIPQARDISNFLYAKTGFQLRPVAGLLSSRDFLNGLAFRVFFSTQYIRHHSKPLYTPEPDICHELLGHAPMFADQDFADFSQEIGLASLGASDEDIKRLATCYWHSVEFGLVRSSDNSGSVKAYGAGLLSSFGELEYSCSKVPFFGEATGPAPDNTPSPKLLPWDPKVAATTEYPICSYQPVYFVANSLADAKLKMRAFCETLPRPFYAKYNTLTNSVWVDRAVRVDQSSLDKLPKGYAGAASASSSE